jgi:hypothetical protein
MWRIVVAGLLLGGCGVGGGSEVDGKWLAALSHSLVLRDGWFEASDPDPVGLCTIAGAYHIQGGVITLNRNSSPCPGAPTSVEWRGEELWRDDGALIYKRWDGRVVRDIPVPDP